MTWCPRAMCVLWLLALSLVPASAQGPASSELTALMDRTALKYRSQSDGAVALAIQGQQLHTVLVRRLESHTVTYCLLARPAATETTPPTLLRVDRHAVPAALWRTIAELNANPWLPRLAHVDGHIVVSVALPHAVASPELLKDSIMAVGTVADLALPRVLAALAAE